MILGITGGISTGKTAAADALASQGIRVVDCDEISRFLTSCDPLVLAAIREGFGDTVFHPAGALNRKSLAAVVFSNAAKRQRLEAILHPPIVDIVKANINDARDRKESIVIVAPLLIEAGMTALVDHLWVISCTAEQQLERLCRRSGADAEDASRRIAAQLPQSAKELYADTVIRNDDSIDRLRETVWKEWQALTGV